MAENNDLIHKGKALKDLRGIKDVLLAQGDPFLAAIMNRAIECIKNQPAVAAVPVVHARWEPHHMVPGFVRCSACRDCITYDEWPDGEKWKRCPNCGAHMDQEAQHG
jgi:hypothetical protein